MSELSEIRNGNFTSSEIIALTIMGSREMTEDELAEHKKQFPKSKKKTIEAGFGEKALTYISEKNYERRLGRSLDRETNARPLSYGKLLEIFVFNTMITSLSYKICSRETEVHPEYDYWCGSADGYEMNGNERETVFDIKAPITPKSFCQLVQPIYDGFEGMDAMNCLRNGYTDKNGFNHVKHPDAEKYYWQLISGACISGCNYAELIVFLPYESQLADIQMLAQQAPAEELSKYYWIAMAMPEELPYLKENGYYKNLNIIRFPVSQVDKEFLTQRVQAAGSLLIPR